MRLFVAIEIEAAVAYEIAALEEELRGIPGVPFRVVQAEARRRGGDAGRVRTTT